MAILSKISVGDILYYTVNDVPVHSAPKGSVSVLDGGSGGYDNSFIYVNNDGGTTWLKSISRGYGEIYINDNTRLIEAGGDQTLGSWYPFESISNWSASSVGDDFYFRTPDNLVYSGDTLIRALISQSSTLRAGASKWVSWQIGASINFIIPNRYNGGFGNDNAGTTNIQSIRNSEMNAGDYVLGGVSPVSVETGGGPTTRQYIARHCQVSALKVDAALKKTVFNETFESGNFTGNSWTVVNDTTNVWFVGTAENNGGTYSAYISNSGGTSASYDINVANVSHFYKDFTIPSNLDSVYLTFDWKCQGENSAGATQYDYGAIVITTTGTTPVAGTEVSTTQAPAGGDGRVGATVNLGKFNLSYGTNPGTTWNTESINLSNYIGQTKRIVFTWKNDGSVGTNPPMIVDNIKIVEYKW